MRSHPDTSPELAALSQLATLAKARSTKDRAFHRAVGTLAQDVTYIAEALHLDPTTRRLN